MPCAAAGALRESNPKPHRAADSSTSRSYTMNPMLKAALIAAVTIAVITRVAPLRDVVFGK